MGIVSVKYVMVSVDNTNKMKCDTSLALFHVVFALESAQFHVSKRKLVIRILRYALF
jgi:hypothetical protein